ncbi:MAG: hypothetical protein E7612_00190 [Ruminococcaceae bacterium]|nr:hypothetical protein [Oscillospiraceae bacterium]
MKSTSKILPAIAMLVVSAVMLTTASFAWFAMNNSATAKGMSVNVKSDSIYLMISAARTEAESKPSIEVFEAGDASYNKADTSSNQGIALDGNAGAEGIFPAAYGKTGENNNAGNVVTSGEQLKDEAYWYTAEGTDAATSSVKADSITALTEGDFGEYVVRYRYYVALASGSNAKDYLEVAELKIEASTEGGNVISPVRVVVACGDVLVEFDPSKTSSDVDLMGADEADVMNAGEVYEIFVYVYYDGNDNSVTTNNLPNLSGANITLKLAVGDDPAQP